MSNTIVRQRPQPIPGGLIMRGLSPQQLGLLWEAGWDEEGTRLIITGLGERALILTQLTRREVEERFPQYRDCRRVFEGSDGRLWYESATDTGCAPLGGITAGVYQHLRGRKAA